MCRNSPEAPEQDICGQLPGPRGPVAGLRLREGGGRVSALTGLSGAAVCTQGRLGQTQKHHCGSSVLSDSGPQQTAASLPPAHGRARTQMPSPAWGPHSAGSRRVVSWPSWPRRGQQGEGWTVAGGPWVGPWSC